MQMALAVKSGKKKISDMPEGVRDKIKKIVDSMSKEKIRHFTKESVNESKEKSKYIITYNDGSTEEREMTESQREALKNDKNWSKIKSVRNMGIVNKKSVKEDGEGGGSAPSTGAATLSNTVGRGSYEFGNNPQNGNSDTKKGSSEPMGGASKRKLTPEEEAMLGITEKSEDGVVKVLGYDDFRARSIKESFVPVKLVTEAINNHFGDFGKEAHQLIGNLPVISGLIETKSISEALSGKYKEVQIRKIIDAISDKRGS